MHPVFTGMHDSDTTLWQDKPERSLRSHSTIHCRYPPGVSHLDEFNRALVTLRSLQGANIPVVTLIATDPSEAPLFARIVSKLSPLLGNVFEDRVVGLLIEGASFGFQWARQDPDFPDAILLDRGQKTDTGFEIKAWYVHSTELTGRFRESVNLLASRNVHVVIVAWTMDRVIYGQPQILGVHIVSALSLARALDAKYHQPPTYLCVEPEITLQRTRNLQQSNVSGYRLQDVTDDEKRAAQRFATGNAHVLAGGSHTPPAVAITRQMLQQWSYRLDTNFAKIDRIDEPGIEAFKRAMLSMRIAGGLTVSQWTTVLRNLTSDSAAQVSLAEARTASLFGPSP